MNKTAIVILNWNGKKWLEKFLPEFVAHKESATLYVADNSSSDDSVQFLKENFASEVKIIQNDHNYGFAGGYNQALKSLEGNYSYYAIVNSDIKVTNGWLSKLLEVIEKDATIFSVQPKVKSFVAPEKFEYAGACGGFIDKNYYPFCRGRIFDTVEKDDGQYNYQKQVFWTSGACMLVDAKKFHELGGFDADFFAHMEEIDLCWRAAQRGYKMIVEPNSEVYHYGGGTLNYESPNKTFLNFRNNLFMIHKNHSGLLFLKVLWRMVLDGVAGLKFLLSGKFKHFTAILKAHFAYYGSIKRLNKKRKTIQSSRKSAKLIGRYQGCILWNYFLKGNKRFSELNMRKFENPSKT